MNLNLQAEKDLEFTLEDSKYGFGILLNFYDNDLNEFPLIAQTTDIGFFIDPQSGVGVAGRQVEVSIRINSLELLGGGYPCKKDNWTVGYVDTNNKTWKTKIQQNRPDRKIGIYNLLLEAYKE